MTPFGAKLRELRKKVTFAILAEADDIDHVASIVENLFALLAKADSI
jgi:type I restriction enzyme R subunit